MATVHAERDAPAELRFLQGLIERLETTCPRRESTSADEFRAQELLGDELAALGLEVQSQPFRFSRSLYAVLALHYGLATLASAFYLWQPWLAAALHLLVAGSYVADCHYRGFWLRRLLPFRPARNIVARLPALGTIERRIVFIAHADAAPTGWMFHPSFLKLAHRPWPDALCLLRKQMLASIVSLLLLATLGVVRATTGYWFPWLYYGFTLGALIPFVLLMQIVLTNRTVPGANDNLTGCAAVVLLADRLGERRPANTEFVFVLSACEEAGRGGSWALMRQMRGEWDPRITTILGLDTLSGGSLRYHVEGELAPCWPSPELLRHVATTAEGDDRFGQVTPYHAPAGATDVAPFLWHGYDGLCLTRISPASDLPPHYHIPADTAANIAPQDVREAVDFAEALAGVIAQRAVVPSAPPSRPAPASRAR
jgi:hypothetical protein